MDFELQCALRECQDLLRKEESRLKAVFIACTVIIVVLFVRAKESFTLELVTPLMLLFAICVESRSIARLRKLMAVFQKRTDDAAKEKEATSNNDDESTQPPFAGASP